MKKPVSGDVQKPLSGRTAKMKGISLLNTLLTLYGILYLVFIIDSFAFAGKYDPYNPENIVVNLAFALFVVGYLVAWHNEGVAGIIFVFWWAIMWYLAIFIVEHDKGSAVVMGLPLFVLGIFFLISAYRKKSKKSPKVKMP